MGRILYCISQAQVKCFERTQCRQLIHRCLVEWEKRKDREETEKVSTIPKAGEIKGRSQEYQDPKFKWWVMRSWVLDFQGGVTTCLMTSPLKNHESLSGSSNRSWKLGPTVVSGRRMHENFQQSERRKVFPFPFAFPFTSWIT